MKSLVRASFKVLGAIWPFVASLLFYSLVLSGKLNFGGGEKDVVLIVPLAAFCLLYGLSYIVTVFFKLVVWKGILASFVASIILFLIIGVVLGPSLLGIQF